MLMFLAGILTPSSSSCQTEGSPVQFSFSKISFLFFHSMPKLLSFSERSKRRTKTLANTNHPRWNQSFVYSNVRRDELRQRVLEVTVWDYDRFGANEFLGGTLDQCTAL